MNQKEKEQVVRMIRATAERRKNTESVQLAEKLADEQMKKVMKSSTYKELVLCYKECERSIKILDVKKDKAHKQIEKLANRFNCSCGSYSGVDVLKDEFHFRGIIDRKITDKTEEVILNVLTAGSSKEAMSFVMELRNMKLY